jgi:uncharacterized protein
MKLLMPAFFILSMAISVGAIGQNKKRQIIDVHFHARYFNEYGTPPPANHITGKVPAYKSNDDVIQIMIRTLKANGIVKAVASGKLDRVAEFEMADSQLFIPALDYPDNQNSPLPDTNTFKRLFEEKKFLVFGELGLQYAGKTLADAELDPYLDICQRLGIPIAVHTGEGPPMTPFTCCPKFRTSLGHPQLIEEVLVRYPKLKVQLMHMGYPYLDETLSLMHIYQNVYADIAVVNWAYPVKVFHKYLQALVDAGFSKRLMYGSDQMAWDDAIPLSIKNVEAATFLTEVQKQDIFYNNAKRFFNIK